MGNIFFCISKEDFSSLYFIVVQYYNVQIVTICVVGDTGNNLLVQ